MADPTNAVDNPTAQQAQESFPGPTDQPVPNANDPGGAHRKGYSAQPGPEPPVKEEGPLPLASKAEAHVQKPDQSHAVQPSPPGGYSPNDRVMGSDR
jgi:hypothetical protein